MAKQHAAIFAALGLTQKDIDTIEAITEDQAKDFKPDTVVEAIRKSVKTVLENDQEFLNAIPEDKLPKDVLKRIESGQYTRFQKELLEAATTQLGLSDKDFEDLTAEEKKSIKKTMVKIAEKHLAKNGKVEGLQKMQADLAEARQAVEKKDADWQTKLDASVNDITTKANAKLIKTLTQVQLASLDKIKLNVPAAYITDPVLNKISSKYKIVLGANDELSIKQLKNDTLDVIDKAGKIVGFKDVLKEVVLEDKLGAEEKIDTPPKKPSTVIVNANEDGETDGVVVPDYIGNRAAEIVANEAKES